MLSLVDGLRWFYVGCAGAFLAFTHFKLDGLAFLEGSEAAGLNFGVMDEQILAAVGGRNESVTLAVVKPFYCT